MNNGQENFFTRDGSFYVDGAGNLCMTSNGYLVMGWGVDPDDPTQILQGDVQKLQIMAPENLTSEPEATTLGYVSGIIDREDPSVNSTSGKTMNLQIYDALGYPYTAKLNLKNTDVDGVFSLELSAVNDVNNQPIDLTGLTFGTRQPVQREVTFNLRNGYQWNGAALTVAGTGVTHDFATLPNALDATKADAELTQQELEARNALIDAYGLDSIADINDYVVAYPYTAPGATAPTNVDITLKDLILDSQIAAAGNGKARTLLNNATLDEITTNVEYIQGHTVEYDPTTGLFRGIDGAVDFITLELSNLTTPPNTPDGESRFENVTVDFTTSTMWNNSGTSTINATNGDFDGNGSGRKMGKMIGISIDTSGMINGTYDNGMTKLLGQIAVAEFPNASGLQKEGDNLYSDTLNSGEFDGIGVDITANGGYMNTGVLEMSNVDLSQEFTEMITTQRGFQANSRIITVSDTLLEELVNLKR